jgi:hypothetical protein
LAYRKAKADAFYENLHPNGLAFTEYEQNLNSNLKYLYEELKEDNPVWKSDLSFIGDYMYIPKSVDMTAWSNSDDIHYLDVDPVQNWQNKYTTNKKRIDVNYRLLIAPTVNYQIISALWIIKVGEKYERNLDTNISYGNRLRRRGSWSERPIDDEYKTLNLDCLGLFNPYFTAYQNWRNNGLKAMKNSINKKKNTTAITMDLAGFYHNIGPRFLTRPSFLRKIGLNLTPDEKLLTEHLLDSLDAWYFNSPDYAKRKEGALPVGLSASRIISNILLYQLDTEIRDNLKPIYYGRYVDDLFLVIETPGNVRTGRDILKSLADRLPSLVVKYIKDKEPILRLNFSYARDSNLFFTAQKQKIFNLSSDHGLDLVDQISSQIREQSSEYRLLPELPDNAAGMAVRSLLASSNASLAADSLRKADVISIRRLGFSLLLKDVESYSRDLRRTEWTLIRKEFYLLISRHLLSPTSLFEFSNYYLRIFKLIVANEDFQFANDFVKQLFDCLSLIEQTTKGSKSIKTERLLCRHYFTRMLLQGAIQASTTRGFSKWAKLSKLLKYLFHVAGVSLQDITSSFLKNQSQQVLLADWGRRPYKDYWYYDQPSDIRDSRLPRSIAVQRVINWLKIKKFFRAGDLKAPHWPALAFPTRALTIQEIGLVAPAVLRDNELFRDAIRGLRGAKVWTNEKVGFDSGSDPLYFHVPKQGRNNTRIALMNFETTDKQWERAVKGNPDLSIHRYENISNLVNQVLKEIKRPDYILFPECSLPKRWAISIAGKLAKDGISLIAGLENHSDLRSKIRNDSLISLTTFWPGYKSNIIYTQPKLAPSHEEKSKLQKVGKEQHKPADGNIEMPIYMHGSYIFGVVNCSDLTTPQNRVRFQGRVDGLYVLEWNPDINTFSFLIEGAAHDIHTFVVQVNNRRFGDSRIRAPYRKDYQRDLVRLKGGIADHYILADMDYMLLRNYQKRNRMVDKSLAFKPVPIGFKMSDLRKKTSNKTR